jgi:hypothetical protein
MLMNSARTIAVDISPLRIIIALGLITVMLFLASGDLFAGHCEEECENECDESCQDCGDCLHCLPVVHMISLNSVDLGVVDQNCAGTIHASSVQRDSADPPGIDHPPQNLS